MAKDTILQTQSLSCKLLYNAFNEKKGPPSSIEGPLVEAEDFWGMCPSPRASHIFTNAGHVPARKILETLLAWRSLDNSAGTTGPSCSFSFTFHEAEKPLCSSSRSSKSKERTSLLYGCSGAPRCSRNTASSATWGIGREGGRAPPPSLPLDSIFPPADQRGKRRRSLPCPSKMS